MDSQIVDGGPPLRLIHLYYKSDLDEDNGQKNDFVDASREYIREGIENNGQILVQKKRS
jgi:hypothetical protein